MLLGFSDAAAARQGLTLGADAIFYGDNTEFRNPFREGETIFGAAVRLDAHVEMDETVTLTLGVFGNQRFGSEQSFETVRPVLAMTVRRGRSRFVFGTLEAPRAGTPPGPDRTGPHGLLPPLQRETLAFERPYEAGLQWTFSGARLQQDAWLHWQRLNTREHRERLDAGTRAEWRARGPVAIPLQAHVVHEGGQLFAAGPVRDSIALATGVVLSHRWPATRSTATIEALGLWSRYTPDREAPNPTRSGAAFFSRAAVDARGWRLHLLAWRGDDFVKDEGDPNYLSIRRDGSRYRGVRDYAETGLTRTFRPAAAALIETSFRLHRIERYYEYSYRVMARVEVRRKVKGRRTALSI